MDGENLTIRLQALASATSLQLKEGPYWKRDVFIWLPGLSPRAPWGELEAWASVGPASTRSHYYTSVGGDEHTLEAVRTSLWTMGFDPYVFKRDASTKRSKGVDIALAKDMLGHAFHGHYDLALLVAGDADYVPLVEEVKRLGKVVHVLFPEAYGLGDKLRLASDDFTDLTSEFTQRWKAAARVTPSPEDSVTVTGSTSPKASKT